jgi:hypothetical protein
MGHPSIAPISCMQLWTGPRVRLSFKERRMKCREPTRLHRKSGLVAGIEPKSAFIKGEGYSVFMNSLSLAYTPLSSV